MYDVFNSVKGLLKIDDVCIDNNVFRLHYKATTVMLVLFSLLVTARQYFGDPIDCIVDDVPTDVMDSYCWIYSTFTVPNRMSGRVGLDVAHPGVAGHVDGEDQVQYHKYYQWVCFVLFFQACCFYATRLLWKTWEGGRIRSLVMDLDRPMLDDRTKADSKRLLLDYLGVNMRSQNAYAARFFVCEVLNLLNVVAQLFLLDLFLDGEFSTYGIDVLRFTEMESTDRVDPMARVFPKVTKCTFQKYGPSGTIQRLDGLCVLPLNVVNEKIYVFLWFWFLLVAAISFLNVLFRVATVLSSRLRALLLRARARLAPMDEVEVVSAKCQVGDWFLLYQLGKNIDTLTFQELLSDLAREMDGLQGV